MADVAELEIRVDSRQTREASKELGSFTKSADTAEKSTTRLSSAQKDTAKSTKEVAKATKEVTTTAKDAAREVEKEGRAFDKAAQEAKQAAREQKRVADAARKMGDDVDFATKQIVALGAAFLALRVAQDALEVITSFEDNLATLRATLGTTQSGMSDLTAQAKELGATTRFTSAQVVEAQLALARSGQAQNEVLETTADVLNLASAANLELGNSAEIVSKTLSQFSLAAAEAAHVTDVLVETANRANTTVPNLAQALAQGGVIAAQTGKSLEEVAATIGVLGNAGIEGAAGGTALRGAISALLKPAGEASKVLADLAARSGQASGAFDISANSIEDVFTAIGQAGATQAELVTIFGREVVAAASVIAQSAGEIGVMTDELTEVGAAAEEVATIMNDTLSGALAGLSSATDALFLSVGETGVALAFRDLVEAATIVVRGLAGVDEKAEEFSQTAQDLAEFLKVTIFFAKSLATGLVILAAKTIAVKIATDGFRASLVGVRTALVGTGVGVLVVGLGELISHLSDSESAIEKVVADMNGLEDANKDTTTAVENLTEAQLAQNKAMSGSLTPVDQLRQEQQRLIIASTKLREEIVGLVRPLSDTDRLIRAQTQAYNIVKQAALDAGFSQAAANREANISARNFGATLAINIQLQKRLKEEQDKANESTKRQAKEVDNVSRFFDKLNEQLEDSLSLDDTTRKLEKLTDEFIELFEQDPKAAQLGELEDLLDQIEETFNQIQSNNALKKTIEDGDAAAQSLVQSLEEANRALSGGLGGGNEAALIQDEYREAIDRANESIDEQVRKRNLTIQGGVEERAAIAQTVEQLVAARTAALRLADANVELEAFSESIERIAEANIDEFPQSLREASAAIAELADQREAAEAAMRALDPDSLRPGEFEENMRRISRAFNESVENLRIQALVAGVRAGTDALVDDFGAAFTSIITGAESVEDAFQNLGQSLLNTAIQQFVVEPVLGALKDAIGSALSSIRTALDSGSRAAAQSAGAAAAAAQLQAGAAGAAVTLQAGGLSAGLAMQGGATSAAAALQTGGVLAGAAITTAASIAAATLTAAAAAAAGVGAARAIAGSLAANGAVVDNGTMMFQRGGIIDNATALNGGSSAGGVLTGAHAFPLRGGGTGIAGEAGPEAIVPVSRMGGGFQVEAELGGRSSSVSLARLSSGRLGVRMFQNGGVVSNGAEADASLAQPVNGGRTFPTADEGRNNVRNSNIVMNITTRDPQSFALGSRSIKRRTQRAVR